MELSGFFLQSPTNFRFLKLDDLADLAERANAIFPDGPPQDRPERIAILDKLEGQWDSMNNEFFNMTLPALKLNSNATSFEDVGMQYILDHPDEFFRVHESCEQRN